MLQLHCTNSLRIPKPSPYDEFLNKITSTWNILNIHKAARFDF
jgi:hypothetical protein